MNFKDAWPVAIAPVCVVVYGYYLSRILEGLASLAGALMIITGITGLISGSIFYYYLKDKYKSATHRVLFGIAGCAVAFGLLVVIARWNG